MSDKSGTTSIEYGLIALIVGVGILAAVQLLGSQVAGTFNSVETAYKNLSVGRRHVEVQSSAQRLSNSHTRSKPTRRQNPSKE